jgi:uncharacterized protein YfaS (alpha-2-macroglobulin family)
MALREVLMAGDHQRHRVAILTSTLLVLGLFTVGNATPTQTGGNVFTPQIAAHFTKDDRLIVAVTLPATQSTGRLTIEAVVGDAIKARVEQAVLKDNPTVRCDLPIGKKDYDKLTLRCTLGNQSSEIPLKQVLLKKGHETTLAAGTEFYANTACSFLCIVQGVRSMSETLPLPGSTVTARLLDAKGQATQLYSGTTNRHGQVAVNFQVPDLPSGQYQLEVFTRSAFGEERLQQAVRLKSDVKILLVSDKPIYQPGHMMHLRALCLQPIDLRPVPPSDILFEIEDPKGNKVLKRALKTSEFGIASVDFQLADEVNMGDYHVRVSIGKHRAEKTVAVKRYQLPKFKTQLTADKRFYLPKETIKATLQSDYFFGKPLSHAKVVVTASTFDVAFRQFQTWKGQTDANGHVKFDITLPDYFVGQPLQKGNALVKLDVQLTDGADRTETITKTYTVSDQSIRVSLLPEGGRVVPDMENRIFAAAVYPDGSPVVCNVKVYLGKDSKSKELASLMTNEAGLAEFRYTPKGEQLRTVPNGQQRNVEMLGGQNVQAWAPRILCDLFAEARDARGNVAKNVVELNSDLLGENVLLRLDKAIYQSGDTLGIDVRTSAGLPIVYIDVVRGGQILLSKWLEVRDGKAMQRLDLPQSVFGTVEIHAYQTLRGGEIIRDSRVVYVQPRNDLKVSVKADSEEYLPGANGRIRFEVTDAQGRPTQAALGVIIVDEAVYALQDLQPGLEKVYFTLQEELLKPQVQVLSYTPREPLDVLVREQVVPADRQQVAEVLMTAIKPKAPPRWQVEPVVERKRRVAQQLMQVGVGLFQYAALIDDKTFQQFDKIKGRWVFAPDLLDRAIKTGNVQAPWLDSPFGGRMTLEEVAALEPRFTPEKLAKAVTQNRLFEMYWALVHFKNNHPQKMQKDGKLVLTDALVKEAIDWVKKQGYIRTESWQKDAWGNAIRLVRRDKPVQHVISGDAGLGQYELVSAGPDGKFGTADDITSSASMENEFIGVAWGNGLQGMNPYLLGAWGARRAGGMLMLGDQLDARVMFGFGANGLGFGNGAGFQGGIGGGGPGGAPMPMSRAHAPEKLERLSESTGAIKTDSAGGAAPITRTREYFPETMLWQPSLITDEKGVADLAVNLADSITTWRLSVSASSRAGSLGGSTVPIKVFQEFFVDIDLPIHLTQNDEVAFPVAVYNYLKTPQKVKLELQAEPWFELLDQGGLTRELELKPNEVTSVRFRIRARRLGAQSLTVKALGSKRSDAVRHVVDVVPDGQMVEKAINDRLSGKVAQTVEIPAHAIPDASKLIVRLYPGIMSQILEGTEAMLRMPGGCFEQTSSSAYPNVLVVDYLKKTKTNSPKLMMQAEQYLNLGYQRLLTFERPGGGFDWWGSSEPLVWLSAYGLQEFNDMARVYPIDRGIVERTQQFLLKKMDKDGTWSAIGATHGETIERMGNAKLLLTSYVTWSLLESELPKQHLKKSIEYIRNHIADAKDNAYILALAANALAAYDAKDDSTIEVLRRLEKQRKDLPDWKASHYPTNGQSLTYARGDFVSVETTALATLAMIKTGQFPNSVNQSLAYLVKIKQAGGGWGTTQATILSLKALLAGMGGAQLKNNLDVVIKVNGKEAARTRVTPENADVTQVFDLKELTQSGVNQVQIEPSAESGLMYQIVGRYYEPWKKEAKAKPGFVVDVTYDRTKLSTKDMLRAKATLKYTGETVANMVMLDLGIAPGFTVDAGDFAEMVAKKHINKFSVTSRQVIIYLSDMRPGDQKTFEYTLRARFPLRAQTPASVAWEYYTPTNRGTSTPVELTVVEDQK